VVTILALAAAVLYGTADFLGGVASRRARVFEVLAITVPAGALVVVIVALLGEATGLGGLLGPGGLGSPTTAGGWGAVGWAAASGVCGASGLIAFYAGFAAAPISVVAPVAALVSTVVPLGVAIAAGERPSASMVAGGLICLIAIVLVSVPPAPRGNDRRGESQRGESQRGESQPRAVGRLRALGYGVAAGAGFGLFFLFLKNAGQSGVLWPVAISRTAGTLVAFGIALATRTRPWRRGGGILVVALVSGAIDAAANVCYVLATRAGLFGLAVVITSLYPGMTVLLARLLLGERMRWLQRAGLLLAAVGVVLLTA
jgi:drug/metabolite transporter (DMT)-like permease